MSSALQHYFKLSMQRFAPFESQPVLAIAVSGGADSMALCLLAQGWVAEHGGKVIALTVDHGLRAESAAEAKQVSRWMQPHGIEHHILHWQHDVTIPGNLQAEARRARYHLLTDWCHAQGVVHLLTGHHRDDQVETVIMRQQRGSVGGKAAIPALSYRHGVQLLRPLLDMAKADLTAWLETQRQEWIDDPSNHSPRYTRNRLRHQEHNIPALLQIASMTACERAAQEEETANWLSRAVTLHPAGFAWLDRTTLLQAPETIQLHALSALVTCIDGDAQPPRWDTLTRFHRDAWSHPAMKRTAFHRCLFIPSRTDLLVCREPNAVAPPLSINGETHWDRRFLLQSNQPCMAGALTGEQWRMVFKQHPDLEETLPKPVLPTLPVFWDVHASPLESLLGIPHMAYYPMPDAQTVSARFSPARPLAGAAFYCTPPALSL